MPTPLDTSVYATLADDGTGTGNCIARAELSPVVYGTTWRIKRMVTTVNIDPTVDATILLRVYRIYETPSRLIDSSAAAIDDVSETDINLVTNEKLIFVWTGPPEAIVGANPICTMIISGDIYDRRRGD